MGVVEVNQQLRNALCNRGKMQTKQIYMLHSYPLSLEAETFPKEMGRGWGGGSQGKYPCPIWESGKQQALREGQKLQHLIPLLNPLLPQSVLSCPKERSTNE